MQYTVVLLDEETDNEMTTEFENALKGFLMLFLCFSSLSYV
jgi:hypothetical protein